MWKFNRCRSDGSSTSTASRRCASIASAVDRVITRERLWMYPIAALSLSVLVFGGSLALGNYPHLAGGAVAFPDYLAHWTGGRMLLDGNTANLFDPRAQGVLQYQEVGTAGLSWFVSPPFAALIYAPFALLGFAQSALLWTVFSLGCLVWSIHLMKPIAPRLFGHHLAHVVVIMAATPPTLELIGSGQDSALSLLLWVAGIRLMLNGKEASAGVVFALGLFKPQQFVLVPIVLMLQRRFRALLAWFMTTVMLALASIAIVGVDGLVSWFKLPFSDFYTTVVQVDQAWKMQSLPALISTILPEHWSDLSSKLGTLAALLGVVVFARQVIRARQRSTPELEVWMVAMLATTALSPHLVIYDLVLVFVPIVYLIENHNTRLVRLACVALFILTWTVSVRHVAAGDSRWPFSLIEAAWTAIPLLILWIAGTRALGMSRARALT